MRRTDTLIIGGGQAGLAMSRCLKERGVDHVILERGRVGERWLSERWDSLRLLTPNWQTRLPGWRYEGADPDGYMKSGEVAGYLDRYARSFAAPVMTGVEVTSVSREGSAYRVETSRGGWLASSVVVATGNCDRPFVPGFASRLSDRVRQVVPTAYRNPAQLPQGGVLVVGASATGIQLADEIHGSGRAVTLAVSSHARLPRRYRGRDIQWWLDAVGVWAETAAEVRDLEKSRRDPSLQLVGSPEGRSVDLGILQDAGVRLVGRVTGARGTKVSLAGNLAESTASADRKLRRLLARIDAFVERRGLGPEVGPPERIRPIRAHADAFELDLESAGIATVVWATGYRRSYPWLRVDVLDAGGEILHDGGVTPSPGLYVLGLQFLRTRKSSFLDGVGDDAAYLAERIARRSDAARHAA